MEGVAARSYKGLRGYFRRRDYERLDRSGRRRRNRVLLASLGGPNRRTRFFRFRIKPKLRFFKLRSPKKFFTGLRDAYVKMMLSFANSTVFASGLGGADGGAPLGCSFGKAPLKEYDEKIIVDFYTSLMVQRKLAQSLDLSRPSGGIANYE